MASSLCVLLSSMQMLELDRPPILIGPIIVCWSDWILQCDRQEGIIVLLREVNEMRPIVVYDGVCHLCDASLRFVVRHQQYQNSFYFIPFQSDEGRFICDYFSISSDEMLTFLLVENGALETKSNAWLRIAAHLTVAWRISSFPLRFVPQRLRDCIYDYVGRHRYRWFGKSDVCMLPVGEHGDVLPGVESIEVMLKHVRPR